MFQLFSQINFRMLFQDTPSFFQLIYNIYIYIYTYIYIEHLCNYLHRIHLVMFFRSNLIQQRVIEVVAQRCFVKWLFLEFSQNSQESTCVRVSFLVKLQRPEAWDFIRKVTLAQVFSYGFDGISKDTFSYRTPLGAVSGVRSIVPD